MPKERAAGRASATIGRQGCDEALPFCERCVAYGLDCEGYGSKRVAFRNQTQANTVSSKAVVMRAKPHVTISLPSIALPAGQRSLLHDFINGFASSRALSPVQNFYKDEIAPLAMEHEHVRSAILALTAAYTNNHRGAETFKSYQDAVQLFRLSLKDTANRQADLACMFILTWFEILIFDPENWKTHLKAACSLINSCGATLWGSSFGRNLIHSIARLDCQNSISGRAAPILDQKFYQLLELDGGRDVNDSNMDSVAVGACERLYGIIGATIYLNDEWMQSPMVDTEFQTRAFAIIQRLDTWYESLPKELHWSDDNNELSRRSHLQKMILLHYYSIKVHIFHMVDPLRLGLWNDSMVLARRCLLLIRAIGPPSKATQTDYKGDLGVPFAFAVVGVYFDDKEERQWINDYLFELGRDTVWCGYERAMCLRAWWQSSVSGKRLIMSRPKREDAPWDWKPEMGMNVGIVYEDLETGNLGRDSYFLNGSQKELVLLPARQT
ncbi:hypothetical protein BP6252_05677 [Coleophoma cylindrospora]|uniref:Zn(2)-C6 fungal-type domain-containing protein n=1 Tax=Coleophoma cylindrospora TaxID=1849047 RepID=A0A3D8RUU1_9HELO|nr:hypothetical protein BP6252_05677 [Coleophoma cylindrospora]